MHRVGFSYARYLPIGSVANGKPSFALLAAPATLFHRHRGSAVLHCRGTSARHFAAVISSALADLEASFDVQLFIRHHASGLSLTQAGRDLLGQARNLLKIAEELQMAAKEMDGGMTGTIALGFLVRWRRR
jgi:hypothetical protein